MEKSNLIENSPILITGADGFIGRHLVAHLSKLGRPVRLSTRRPKTIAGQASIAMGDIGPDTDWSEALSGCTKVVHLAGRAHILKENTPDPALEFNKTNHQATATLAAQAARAGVRRFVLASTIGIYHPQQTRLDAGVVPATQNDYGRSKLSAEQALENNSTTEMSYTILRLPLVYGPGVGARFLQLLKLASLPLPLPFASLRNQRSLVYVENLAELVALALTHPKAADQTFLVCDGDDVSTPDLLRHLASGMGRRPVLLPFPARGLEIGAQILGKPELWRKFAGTLTLDASPLRRQLGWVPPFSAAQGLNTTAKWYKQHHGRK